TYAPPVRVELVCVWPSLSGVHRRPRTVVCLDCRTFARGFVLAALRRRWPRTYRDGRVDIRSVLCVPCGRRLDDARQGARGRVARGRSYPSAVAHRRIGGVGRWALARIAGELRAREHGG